LIFKDAFLPEEVSYDFLNRDYIYCFDYLWTSDHMEDMLKRLRLIPFKIYVSFKTEAIMNGQGALSWLVLIYQKQAKMVGKERHNMYFYARRRSEQKP
jgi:hypothetical protein